MDHIPVADKEAVSKEQVLQGRIEEISQIVNEIGRDTPGVALVFACSMKPGHLTTGRVGDSLLQLGLLSTMETLISLPIAGALAGSSRSPILTPGHAGLVGLKP
jgi:hypothetical protein